jgi:hypothetical protein
MSNNAELACPPTPEEAAKWHSERGVRKVFRAMPRRLSEAVEAVDEPSPALPSRPAAAADQDADQKYDGPDGAGSPISAPLVLDPALLAAVAQARSPEPGLMALWAATDGLFGQPQPAARLDTERTPGPRMV